MPLPEPSDLKVTGPTTLLEAIVRGSTSRGQCFAHEALLFRFFWWQEEPDVSRPTVAKWRDELVRLGEINIRPLGISCLSDSPINVITIVNRQRFQRFAARPKIPKTVRNEVYARDAHACRYCGETSNLSIDHIHAFSKGGSEDPDNFQTLCRSCNSRKGAK